MSGRSKLDAVVEGYLDKPCEIRAVNSIPDRDAIVLGADVSDVEATALSIDIRQFSGMTNALGRQLTVRMLKAFFDGSVTIVSANAGVVADFNGDGMIVLFTGPDRSARAFLAASQIRWFLTEVLRPKFASYFGRERNAFVDIQGFDAGCGLDDGPVLVARVGASTFSDIAWVGRCVNTAAKMCKTVRSPRSTIVTHEIYERLDGSHLWPLVNWSAPTTVEVGGISCTAVATDFMCEPDLSNLF